MANLKVGKSPFLEIKVGTDFYCFCAKIVVKVSLAKALFGAVTGETLRLTFSSFGAGMEDSS